MGLWTDPTRSVLLLMSSNGTWPGKTVYELTPLPLTCCCIQMFKHKMSSVRGQSHTCGHCPGACGLLHSHCVRINTIILCFISKQLCQLSKTQTKNQCLIGLQWEASFYNMKGH